MSFYEEYILGLPWACIW